MARKRKNYQARRTRRRIITMVILVLALIGGWSWFWHYAADKAQVALDGWRAREAKAGRIYSCGSQTFGGYPFRFEVECDQAAALFRSNQPPLEVKAGGMSIVAQVYQPNLLITEFHGPLTIADLGHAPNFIVNWKLAQSSVSGTPAAPERVSMVFDKPVVERVTGANRQTMLRAQHIEIHGRIAEGSAASQPVIETVLRLRQASAADIAPVLAQPVDADITAVLRGLNNFAPKPWPARFREIQAAGGRIDITAARVRQGETIAVGNGALSLNANGRLQGQLRVTVAGVEPFLAAIGAQQMVQTSPDMDKVAGALDRLLPGLGGMARQQATGSNLSLGINLLGEHTTLEGKPAVIVPLHFDDGSIFLGPIKIGNAPALF
jgi:hypothetical protein